MKLIKLPEKINVDIKRLAEGKIFAEIIDYGIFTEAQNEQELILMINDLIYTYFDIPKALQKEFHYEPRKDKDFEKAKPFIFFGTKKYYQKYLAN